MNAHGSFIYPAFVATPDADAFTLPPDVALAELRDSLNGWIAVGIQCIAGYPHDPALATSTAHEILASLMEAAVKFHDGGDYTEEDPGLWGRYATAGRHLQYAANELSAGLRLLGDGAPTIDAPPPAGSDADDQPVHQHAFDLGIIRTLYAAAVAYTRQASIILYNGPRSVAGVLAVSSCYGGTLDNECVHARQEDHFHPHDGRCEAVHLAGGTDACAGETDAVIVRDGILGPRKAPEDRRGIRACTHHGAIVLSRIIGDGGTVYPGPGDRQGDNPAGGSAVAVYTQAHTLRAAEGVQR